MIRGGMLWRTTSRVCWQPGRRVKDDRKPVKGKTQSVHSGRRIRLVCFHDLIRKWKVKGKAIMNGEVASVRLMLSGSQVVIARSDCLSYQGPGPEVGPMRQEWTLTR